REANPRRGLVSEMSLRHRSARARQPRVVEPAPGRPKSELPELPALQCKLPAEPSVERDQWLEAWAEKSPRPQKAIETSRLFPDLSPVIANGQNRNIQRWRRLFCSLINPRPQQT